MPKSPRQNDDKRFISSDIWDIIKARYVAGIEPVIQIAADMGVSRKQIQRKAKKERWIKGENKDEVKKSVADLAIMSLVEKKRDIFDKKTDNYLIDIENLRRMAVRNMNELNVAYAKQEKTGVPVTVVEYNRIFAAAKVVKITTETIKLQYEGLRKAFGLEKEEEDQAKDLIDLDDRIKARMELECKQGLEIEMSKEDGSDVWTN